jgi:hypothetical protein
MDQAFKNTLDLLAAPRCQERHHMTAVIGETMQCPLTLLVPTVYSARAGGSGSAYHSVSF